MTNHFRRSALQLGMAALLASAFTVHAADIPQVKVTVTDKQCEPMSITVNAGKTQFIIQNHSQKALEWEILKGVMVVEERENIAPGFSQKMTANLQPGEYDMTCGLLTNPKGKLIVKGSTTADAAQSDALLSLGWGYHRLQSLCNRRDRAVGGGNQSLHRCHQSRRSAESEVTVCAHSPAL